jgi:hypothetical protein
MRMARRFCETALAPVTVCQRIKQWSHIFVAAPAPRILDGVNAQKDASA